MNCSLREHANSRSGQFIIELISLASRYHPSYFFGRDAREREAARLGEATERAFGEAEAARVVEGVFGGKAAEEEEREGVAFFAEVAAGD